MTPAVIRWRGHRPHRWSTGASAALAELVEHLRHRWLTSVRYGWSWQADRDAYLAAWEALKRVSRRAR